MCANEDLGRIVAENLRIVFAQRGGIEIAKVKGHVSSTTKEPMKS